MFNAPISVGAILLYVMSINELINMYERDLDRLDDYLKSKNLNLSKIDVAKINVSINEKIHFIQHLKNLDKQ